MREYSHCRGCNAEIEWAWLNGKAHPFDVDPTTDGSHELYERPGDTRTLAVYAKGAEGKRLVKSHFATCPNAEDFRSSKKREAARPDTYWKEPIE